MKEYTYVEYNRLLVDYENILKKEYQNKEEELLELLFRFKYQIESSFSKELFKELKKGKYVSLDKKYRIGYNWNVFTLYKKVQRYYVDNYITKVSD